MAAPLALLGLPWLGSVLAGLVASLFTWFLKFFSKRIAITVSVITALVGITAAFFAGLTALIEGLSVAVPIEVQTGMALFMPDNTVTCLSSIMTAHVAKYAYDWQAGIIKWKMYSS